MSSNPHPVDIHVGQRLRLKRSILGKSQENIGKEIGVTFQQIQKYERGINRMGASRLYDFAKALGVQVSYFFEGYGDYVQAGAAELGMGEPEAAAFEHDNALNNRETLDVMRAFGRIKNPAMRKKIIELIKTFADDSDEKAALKSKTPA